MKLTVNLNDFETFDRLLFNEDEMKLPEKERWKKFWDGETVVVPIPMYPDTIEEYQLCHYAYWMTIAEHPWLKTTPPILAPGPVRHGNYDCEYVDRTGKACRGCPVIDEKYGDLTCTSPNHPLEKWLKNINNEKMRRKYALEYAKTEWKDRINM